MTLIMEGFVCKSAMGRAFTKFKWDERHCKQVGEDTGVWLICGSRWESLAGKSKVIHNVTLHQPDCPLGQIEDEEDIVQLMAYRFYSNV